MSSAAPAARRTRWIDPAGWPLRTRIVTTMIALLAVLGLVVGGTAELYLYNSLHKQVDTEVDDLSRRIGFKDLDKGAFGDPGKKPLGQQPDNDPSTKQANNLPGGIPRDAIVLQKLTDGTFDGGVLKFQPTVPDEVQTLSATALATVIEDVPADGSKADVSVGDGLPQYRMKKVTKDTGDVYYIGISLKESNSTLLQVALFTGCVILGSLIIAGWGGALIVRRTLMPLDRVAATATRVSELRLDRGEVQLAQRVPEQDTDPRTEVGQVGAALNRMLDHVGNALEARHASEMQVRQFVADASHELRTPLAAIRGYAELSRRSRKPIPDEIAHVLTRVESEAKRMTALVEDLLLLARLDAGRPLAQDPVDLTMLAVDATSDAHAAGPRHYWQLDLPEEPVTVIGDGARLHQVVANLLANARTHTPEGSTVTVKVGSVPNAAVVQVIDNGPGIQQDLVPRIFERFARGDSSRSRAAGSTGLGLSIVHAVVTSHRGKVGVQSRPGQTIFTVMLPLGPPPVVPTAEQRPQMLHPVR
ncbi:sensor histidine kinase [Actinoplanes couchii]|uniref:histidine kinase n=1 Tax=Actinoplanes couchii TaxID=403638 RepID=A0ABQ3XCI0_9ACTN|nr:HAMP domain-containing sensor histidine kinase [Actinoplanes couchii]MDR6323706.1 two-component system OmpR family sensor kinase [Actinoplanes couchii]GID56222.1 two-component sensor histidine kinase [Actinoplanes couchii]